jgi:hypothetical protein
MFFFCIVHTHLYTPYESPEPQGVLPNAVESFICLDGTCSFKVYWDKYLATAVSNID